MIWMTLQRLCESNIWLDDIWFFFQSILFYWFQNVKYITNYLPSKTKLSAYEELAQVNVQKVFQIQIDIFWLWNMICSNKMFTDILDLMHLCNELEFAFSGILACFFSHYF